MKEFLSCLILFFSAFALAQQTEYVDFKTAKVHLDQFNPYEKSISGKVDYTFDVLKPVDSFYLDSRYISDYIIHLNNKEVEYYVEDNKLWLITSLQPSENNTLKIQFNSVPKKAIYFIGWNDKAPNQIWTQGQGKYTSSWLPSFDDTNEKVEFDLSITFNKEYEVISNGKLKSKELKEEATTWDYDMQQPMSSYLVALAIGKYNKKVEISKSGIPLEMYYYPEDSLKVEPTYRHTKRMFDFLEEEIGVPYPWQNYKQVPVHDFLYAGMENTSCTIFSDAFMVDDIAFADKNYVNINAHELAHQWFGNLVTAKSGEHHWLQEGFATYYALLAERKVFGDDYYYWSLYEYAQELLEQDKAGKSTPLLDPKSSSLTFYKKGAWVLHMLREKVGDKPFKLAVENYLRRYEFKNAETDDFLTEVEKTSREDLEAFKQKWLVSKELHYKLMEDNLCFLSNSIKTYVQFDCTKTPEACKIVLQASIDDTLKSKIIRQLEGHLSKSTFSIEGVKSRQAIAQNLTEIPSELKTDYESLLNDKSYITIESALFNLWNNFPEDRLKYLDKTKHIQGFSNKNVRLLWLTLVLLTPEYQPGQSEILFDELLGYTSPEHNYELRQNAFEHLMMLRSCGEECRENLEQATKHHNWRMVKFAKEKLKLLEN